MEETQVKISGYTEAQKKATQRYREKNKDKVNEQRKKYYHERKEADPSYLEYKRDKARAYYRRKKSTTEEPEGTGTEGQGRSEDTPAMPEPIPDINVSSVVEQLAEVKPVKEKKPRKKVEKKPEPEPVPEPIVTIEVIVPEPKKEKKPRKKTVKKSDLVVEDLPCPDCVC